MVADARAPRLGEAPGREVPDSRATQELGFFAPGAEDVRLATTALRRALATAGLVGEVVRSGPAFARLVVTGRSGPAFAAGGHRQ